MEAMHQDTEVKVPGVIVTSGSLFIEHDTAHKQDKLPEKVRFLA